MTETEQKEIIASVKSQLTGELKKDILFLQQQVNQYAAQQDGAEVADELMHLAMDRMPKEQTDYLNKVLYIGKRRLDAVYNEAYHLSHEKQSAKALTLTKQLYEHIIENFKETNTARFFSFRNLLESNLYYQLYHPTKNLLKAPFDFTRYIGLHGYTLIDVQRPEEAIPVLKEAIRFNPVNPDPRFELAEAYKIMRNMKELLHTIKDTLPICYSAYALSRCYTNMGYYCTEIKDYENAVAFYFESMVFYKHPAVPGELHHVSQLMGRKIAPPTRKEVLAAFEKYELHNGPGEELLYTVTSMSNQAIEKENWAESVFYLQVITDLTNDPAAKTLLERCQKRLEEQNSNKSHTNSSEEV